MNSGLKTPWPVEFRELGPDRIRIGPVRWKPALTVAEWGGFLMVWYWMALGHPATVEEFAGAVSRIPDLQPIRILFLVVPLFLIVGTLPGMAALLGWQDFRIDRSTRKVTRRGRLLARFAEIASVDVCRVKGDQGKEYETRLSLKDGTKVVLSRHRERGEALALGERLAESTDASLCLVG